MRFPFFRPFPFQSPTSKSHITQTRFRRRPVVEQLEDRIAPATATWSAIGPAPITGISDGGQVAGRVTSIATDPNPADTTGGVVYIGSPGGGVWKGQNIHSTSPTWTPLTDNLAAQTNDPLISLNVGAIATAWNGSNTVIYAGLGEANAESNLMSPGAAASQFYGEGIIKSVDGGQTWSLLGGSGASNQFYGSAFSKIIIDPNNVNIVYAAVSTAKNGVTGNEGIWRSTNGGLTWTNTTATGIPGSSVDMFSDLVMDPGTYSNPVSTQVLYAAIGEAAGSQLNGVYMSANGGQTWTIMTNLPSSANVTGEVGRISLAISPNPIAGGDHVLYAAFMTTKLTSGGYSQIGTLYQLGYSTVSGTSPSVGVAWNPMSKFTLPTTGSVYDYVGTQGYYDTSLIVSPNDAYTIFAGGQDKFIQVTGTNSTVTVADFSTDNVTAGGVTLSAYIHVDHHGIAIDPNPAAGVGAFTVLDGNDGGIYNHYPIIGSNVAYWADLNTNLQLTQNYDVAVNPLNPAQIYASAQDNGNFWTSGGTSQGNLAWQSVTAGDGSGVFIDSTSTAKEQVFVTKTANLYTSNDPFGTASFSAVSGGTPGRPNGIPGDFPAPTYTMQVVNGQDYLWYGGEDATTTGDDALWFSKDGGASWYEVGSPVLGNGWPAMQKTFSNGFQVDNTAIDSIAVSPTNPNIVWVGLRGGQILMTTQGTSATATWTPVNGPVSLTSTTISAASNGQTLPQSTINVQSTTGFPSSGQLFIQTSSGHSALVTYTGITPTSFTGCSGGSAETLATGDTVTFQNDLRYSSIQVAGNGAVYVTAANFGSISGGGHVWVTSSNGASWKNLTGNLPNVPTWTVQVDQNAIYIGNDLGVYSSTNGGMSWSRFGSGLPNTQVRAIDRNPNTGVLTIGTYGRGVWQIPAAMTPGYTNLDGYLTQITTTTNASNTLTVFGIGGDHAAWYNAEIVGNDPTQFAGWTSLGGYVTSLTSASPGSSQVPIVFGIGGDGQVWFNNTLTPNAWNRLVLPGGLTATQLAATNDGQNNVAIFAITNAGNVELNFDANGIFSGWINLGGYAKQVVAGENPDGTVQTFVIGGNNALYTNLITSATISSGWNFLGGYVQQIALGQNLAAKASGQTLQLFAVGGDNAAWTIAQTAPDNVTAAGFTGWQSLGGYVTQLAVARNTAGLLQLIGSGGDHATWSRTQMIFGALTTSDFTAWQSFGGYVQQLVAGTNASNQTFQFFAIGGDNAVYTQGQSPLLPASPQLLAGTPLVGSDPPPLTTAELAPIVAEAEERWEALGVSATEFQGLQFQIGQLSAGWLGRYQAGTITLDTTADGYGWFVDPTPSQDEEFTLVGGRELALPGTAASGHVDLLTVVMHELGHALGLTDVAGSTDIMTESLAAGVRRTPTIADVDAAFR